MEKKVVIKTLQVRVRDKHATLLNAMAKEVNFTWNYYNELSYRHIQEHKRWLSAFDLQKSSTGASKEFNHIGAGTVQQVAANRGKLAHFEDENSDPFQTYIEG